MPLELTAYARMRITHGTDGGLSSDEKFDTHETHQVRRRRRRQIGRRREREGEGSTSIDDDDDACVRRACAHPVMMIDDPLARFISSSRSWKKSSL